MTLNPFDEQLRSAEQEAAALDARLREVGREIVWFEATTLDTLVNQREELRSDAAVLSHESDDIRAEARQLENEIRVLSKSIGPLWNPVNLLDARQRGYRAHREELKASHAMAKKRFTKIQASLGDAQRREKEKDVEIERHTGFDLGARSSERADLARRLAQQTKQVEIASGKKRQVDAAIEPLISQMREVDREKSDTVRAIERAQRLDRDLSGAQNSYERAMVHETCMKEFGTGSPGKVISLREADVRRLDRNLEKLQKRAGNVASKAARDVRQLVVDGNNLCYEGNRFIGLGALRTLVPILSESYDVIVVFDASIREALHGGDAEVRDAIGGNAKVHIVATGVKADETVLDLVGSDQTAFIVSNDRFAEFGEKPAIRDGRLIRHEIVGGRVFVHDLGVSEEY